jgi:glycosyltransferase 2 family protein
MKQFISFVISLLILGVIYWQIDISLIAEVLLQSNISWLVLGFGMVIPITLLTALRLTWMVPSKHEFSYLESLRLILAANTMNMMLPSKMGDVAKCLFLADDEGLGHAQALSLVIFEKISDFLALLLWCVFGLTFFLRDYWFRGWFLFVVMIGIMFSFLMLTSVHFIQAVFKAVSKIIPIQLENKLAQLETGWKEMVVYINMYKMRFIGIMLFCIFLWLLHLGQIWVFIMSLNVLVPFIDNLALTPLAILIGLLPLTFAGVGTRDAAFIFLYANYFTTATGAALGLFATMRYVIPALFGIPFLSNYINKIVVKRQL